ncbi:MAG: 2-oxoacid:acceptor oxidoreductase subunit alpha [Armatimonadetes bacterium]|nr:2-oxoacid:acceptor oxidoreductase subunit alpha [Armatimonadota bacterium]
MTVNSLKILIGGVQLRDGVSTVADLLGKVFTRAGLFVLANERNYASTIYGAHQFDPIMVSDSPPLSHGDDRIDILLALEHDSNPDAPEQPNRDTILRHGKSLAPGGILIYDSSTGPVPESEFEAKGIRVFPLPARSVAQRELKKEVVKNTFIVGALFRLLEFDMDHRYFRILLEERFLRKSREMVDLNMEAARRGREAVEDVLAGRGWADSGHRLADVPPSEPVLFLSGTDALCLGAIQAGCRFYAGYPITPASGILEFMDRHLSKFGGRSLQGQNERESIRAALGAGMAGVRSMVGTSGPGLSLKVEEIGLSGAAEIPLVIVNAQRAGPSTGMPTKTEQGDLATTIHAGHGDFPRIVLAPSSLEESYSLIIEAFNLADKYQCPVFFLTDLTLAEVRKTIPESFFSHPVSVKIAPERAFGSNGYRRYAWTDSGISPLIVPGTPGAILKATGTEHDEDGFVTTDPPKRQAAMDKRMRKMETYLREDAREPQVVGDPTGKPVLVGWGSTGPVLLSARERLARDGTDVAVVHFTHLWPFPTQLALPVLKDAAVLIVCEQNYGGQFADILQAHCLLPTRRILKYNGRVFYVSEIVESVGWILEKGAETVRVGEMIPTPTAVHEGD